jgi:hypothetical protein
MSAVDDKANQLERDFGVTHPLRRLRGGLRRRDDRDIEPFTIQVGRDRLAELDARGFGGVDGLVVLLMRGARVEILAKAIDQEPDAVRGRVVRRIKMGDLDTHMTEALRTLNLSWRY